MAVEFQDRRWLAQVLSPTTEMIKGAAFALSRDVLVTCAHVVQDAGASAPGGRVRVCFPVLERTCDAVVLDEGWAPSDDRRMAGDLALLGLAEPLPGVEVLPLRSLRSLDGLGFSAYGFPEKYDYGIQTSGTLGKAVGLERVQLEVSSAEAILPGFSGAAVWNDELHAIVALLTSRDLGTQGRVAFASPLRIVAEYSPIVAAALQTPLDLDPDRATHWGPRSRGVSVDRDEAGWLFSGREAALSDLSSWLREDRPPALRVVTARPGSGKSAVLARLVTTADRHYRSRIPDLRPEDPTVPPEGAFDATFHARDRTVAQFVDHVANVCELGIRTAAGQPSDDITALRSALNDVGGRLSLVVDAVDEAKDAKSFCSLLEGLAEDGNRVLVGCRPHLVAQFLNADTLDLDQPPYLGERDVELYIRRLLAPRLSQEANATRLARELATAAAGNFLVAQLTAQAFLASGSVVMPFPRSVPQAFERLLDSLQEPDKVRDLLLPLALAFGDGLPSELWLAGAAALRRPYQPADLDDLLDSPAASFLITRLDAPGGRRHRLFHQALIEALLKDRDLRADHKRLLAAWTDSLAVTADGQRSWADASPYLCLHAAEHAAIAGTLDPLIENASYVVAADPDRLLLSLPLLITPVARVMRTVYRRAFDALRSAQPAERPSYLELAARQGDADECADQIARAAPARPWSTPWARWEPIAEHFIAGRHPGGAWAMALGELDGRPIAISGGGDRTLRIWDLGVATEVGTPLTGHDDGVRAVAFGELDGRPIVLSGSYDATVRVWDLESRTQRGGPLTGHERQVSAVALGELEGRAIAVSGGIDATVRVWDLESGAQRGAPLQGHSAEVMTVALGVLESRTVALSGDVDGMLRVWDLASGSQRGDPLKADIGGVYAVALGELDGQPVAVAGTSVGSLYVWDLTDGRQLGGALRTPDYTVSGIWALALGALDGQPVALSAGTDGTVRVWDLKAGIQRGEALRGHNGYVSSVALGALEGRPVTVSAGGDGGTIRVWSLDSLTEGGQRRAGYQSRVRSTAVGELDGEAVVVSGSDDSDGTVRLWDRSSGRPRGAMIRERYVFAVALAGLDGQPVLLTAGGGSIVRVWDPNDGTERREPLICRDDRALLPAAFGIIDGRPVALTTDARGRLAVWDVDAGTQRRDTITGHGQAAALAIGELDGQPIVVAGAGGGGDRTLRIWGLDSGKQLGEPLTGHDSWVNAIALGTLNGGPIALSGGGGDDGTVRAWDLRSGGQHGEPLTQHGGSVGAVSLGELDGRPIALSGGQDGVLRVSELCGVGRLAITIGSSIHAIAFCPPSGVLLGANAGLVLIEFSGPNALNST